MSGETYAIVFKGEVVEGFDAAKVRAQLAKLLKADEKKAAALFSGKQIVLKKTTDKAEAAKYGKALKKVGADVKIRIIKAGDTPPPTQKPKQKPKPKPKVEAAAPVFEKAAPPVFQKADDAPAFEAADAEPAPVPEPAASPEAKSEPAAAAPAVDTSGITIAPNEGDLFEPEPEVDAPDIDLSSYSVAENDGAPLVEPAEDEVIVDLDLSEFSVKENDGTPLIEESDEEVPEIDVPDFGLDEPGAVLETIQEEKELLNPNTMGMSMAATGADLLEDDEKPQGPPPLEPDTSSIHLEPNFDT